MTAPQIIAIIVLVVVGSGCAVDGFMKWRHRTPPYPITLAGPIGNFIVFTLLWAGLLLWGGFWS